MRKVMVFYPPGPAFQRGEDRCQANIEDSTSSSPRADNDLGYASSTLRARGYDAFLKDYQNENLPMSALVDGFSRYSPDVIFISTTNSTVFYDLDIVRRLKESKPDTTCPPTETQSCRTLVGDSTAHNLMPPSSFHWGCSSHTGTLSLNRQTSIQPPDAFLRRCRSTHANGVSPGPSGNPKRPLGRTRLGRPQIAAWIRLLRPEQWIKNGFILMPLIFSFGLLEPQMRRNTALASIAFCLAASGIYCVNDLADARKDALHPEKKSRPIASGLVSPSAAIATMAVLCLAALYIGQAVNSGVTGVIGAYIAVNVAYSYGLKDSPILDVFALASGYVLRVLAGAAAIGVSPTPWILVVTFFISLVLGFGKRRSEIAVLERDASDHRGAPSDYGPALLDTLVVISVSSTIISYSIYAVETSTKLAHSGFVLTVPFVVFGLFRYLYILLGSGKAENPTKLMLTDRPLQVSVAGWLAVVLATLYLK